MMPTYGRGEALQKQMDLECTIDYDFELMRDSREYGLYMLVTRITSRLSDNEGAPGGIDAARAAIGLGGMLFNEAMVDERRGWELASTIPQLNSTRCLRCWLPTRFSIMPGWGAYELDWLRPTWRTGKLDFYITTTPILHHMPLRDPSVVGGYPLGTVTPWNYYSLGAGFSSPKFAFPKIGKVEAEVGARHYRPYGSSGVGGVTSFDAALNIFGRLVIGWKYFPDNHLDARTSGRTAFGGPTTLGRGAPVTWHLSIADFPGLLYWLKPGAPEPMRK